MAKSLIVITSYSVSYEEKLTSYNFEVKSAKEEIEKPFSQANILKEKELDYGK